MCGIAGWAGWQPAGAETDEQLYRMCDVIRHRGPDDAGYYIDSNIAIGMRRLSIIDLEGGRQPITNENGTVFVVFNGEIYNFRELRGDLSRSGHRFLTDSDTEVIVHLYEEHGDAFVGFLRGMFAIALWDASRHRLLLVRDRLGIKPLYYRNVETGVVFGSELKSILALGDLPRRIDRSALGLYLMLGYVPDPFSIYSDVRKLEPGHLLIWERGRPAEIRRYWSPVREEDRGIDEATAIKEIRSLLEESVRYRLISDVPLGAFLSGGLDSTAVVATMCREVSVPVKTFSIGFADPEYDETRYAAAVARALGTDHTELVIRPGVDRFIEGLVSAFDEPFSDWSAIPMLMVSALARREVTVALSGDGGDELFGGYTRYVDVQSRVQRMPRVLAAALGGVARRLPYGTLGRNRLLEYSRPRRGKYAGTVAQPLPIVEGGVARPEVATAVGTMEEVFDRWFNLVEGRSFTTQMLLVDALSYLPGDILTKVDRMSMAVSLEARVPMLDHRLAEFAFSLPSDLKFRDGNGKWIFRRAVRGLVPDFVLERPKHGFGVPLKHWLRNELGHRVQRISTPGSLINEYVDPAAVNRIIKEHQSGRRNQSRLIWKLLVLELWLEGLEVNAHRSFLPVIEDLLGAASSLSV